MADDLPQFNLPTMQAYNMPFSQFLEDGMFKSPTSALQSGMDSKPSIFGFSSENAGPQDDGTGSVTNTTQDASKTSGNLMQALEAVNKFYKEGMKGMYEGIPVPGDENIRMHTGLQGQRYFTLRTTPTSSTDIYGRTTTGKDMPKETISFGIPRGEGDPSLVGKDTGPKSWESGGNVVREGAMARQAQAIAGQKEQQAGMGYDPETGVYDPRGDDSIGRESTGLMKDDASRKAAASGAARMEAGQRYSDEMIKGLGKGMTPIGAMQAYKDYNNAQTMERLYDKAGASLSPTGRVAFGKGGYAYTSDRKSTPESRAFVESEMKKKRKEMGV
jgi:hypothetical protein